MPKKKDLTGKSFGRLTVIKEHPVKTRDNKYQYECYCSCGNPEILIKTAAILASGDCKSCGCLQREHVVRLNTERRGVAKSHGQTGSKTYICWKNMKARCDDKNHTAYSNYGGRGITYDPRWITYELFVEDMGQNPEGMSLNRIDVNRMYCKENCEWTDRYKQSRDQRKRTKPTSCKYKGVSFSKQENKYKGTFQFKGRCYHLGYHSDPRVLAEIYDNKVREITGEDSGTNSQLGLLV